MTAVRLEGDFTPYSYKREASIVKLIIIIKRSSIMVTVLMGKLNTAPKQAHFILRLFATLCSTPIMLTVITIKVIVFVKMGLNLVRKAIPKASSAKAYI